MNGNDSDRQIYPFGIIPAEVFMDERLTLETLRVLGALYTFRDKHTSLAFPSRDELSSRCTAIHPSNISAATTRLVELGWLVKEGKGGNSRAIRYTIKVPDAVAEMAVRHRAISKARRDKRVAEQATVAQTATIAEQATLPTLPIADDAARGDSRTGNTQRVAEPTTRIEQTNGTDQLGTNQRTGFLAPDKSSAPAKKSEPVTNESWEAYNTAYFKRYGTEMIRTGKTNGQMMELIRRVGKEDAPHIAAFYVSHNNKYYIQNQHTLGALVSDAESIRTQWITGRTMTSTRANQLDSTATNASAAQEAIAMLRRRNGNASV